MEATSHQLKFIMERVTTGKFRWTTLADVAGRVRGLAEYDSYPNLSNLIELHGIAQKYLLEEVCFSIRHTIVGYAEEHPPMALSFACQCNPPSAPIARSALRNFARPMEDHMLGVYFVDFYTHEGEDYCNPFVGNLSRNFARELGVDALLAYTKACLQVFGDHNPWTHEGDHDSDWRQVAELFIGELEIDNQDGFDQFMD